MFDHYIMRSILFLSCFLLILSASLPIVLHAQNLVVNGSFTSTDTADDIYDGVDKSGNLKVFSDDLPILIEGSSSVTKNFGASPCWKDVTGDGTPDLVVGDGCGFLWIFEATSRWNVFPPTFSQGRFIHTFLGQAINIDVADYNGDGFNDVLVGTVEGAIQIMKNKGDGTFLDAEYLPSYANLDRKRLRDRLPVDLSKSFPLVMQGDKPVFIGSFLAPRLVDWNGDGKNDLIVGEGSYSANSVYLFKNGGQNSNPDFTAAPRNWLAYGMGREHLTPTVGDLDGDGDPDLLVGERTGALTLYENDPAHRTADTPYLTAPAATQISVGGSVIPVGEFVRPYLADVDNDKDLDLFLGTSDGSIFISRNSGSRTQPKFDKAIPLKGVDLYKPRTVPKPAWNQYPPCPWWWEVRYGNSGATHEIQEETDPATGTRRSYARVFLRDGYFGRDSSFEYPNLQIEYGQQFSLRFMYRGNNVTVTTGIGRHGESQVEGDTRVYKFGEGVRFDLTATPAWRQFNKTFTIKKAATGRTENFAPCWLYFNLNTAQPESYFDITDIVIEKVTL